MKTIQIIIDESLLSEVDRVTGELHTTRSAFIREASGTALRRHDIQKLEQQHAVISSILSNQVSSTYG